VHDFNFRQGPDPHNNTDVASSDFIEVMLKYWGYNTMRPSTITLAAGNRG